MSSHPIIEPNQVSDCNYLTLTSLNCHNFKSNILYAKEIVSKSDFIYLNETWLTPSEKPLLESIILNKSHKLVFKSDMTHIHKKGRPFGGQAWYINSSFSLLEYKFINKHISYVKIDIKDCTIVIIGVYLPFDNNKIDSKTEYESCICILSALVSSFNNLDIPIILCGDFNADHFRCNKFDKIFDNFINDQNLLCLDSLFTQKTHFTYLSNYKSNVYCHNIDHLLINRNHSQRIDVITCTINNDLLNTSDHNSISLEFKVNHLNNYHNNNCHFTQTNLINPNMDDPNTLLHYHNILNDSLKNTCEKYISTNNTINNQMIDELYNELCNTIFDCYNQLKKEITTNTSEKKNWFTNELKEIKSNIMYFKYNSNLEPEVNDKIVKNLKKKFRSIQRRNIWLDKLNEYNKFERIAKLKDKNQFWKYIRKK